MDYPCLDKLVGRYHCVTCDAQVVLCSNHGEEAPQAYQPPPAPDSSKLEIAQQQGLAMGLPPFKAKGTVVSRVCYSALLQCTQFLARKGLGIFCPLSPHNIPRLSLFNL